jgi:hypothetical protein
MSRVSSTIAAIVDTSDELRGPHKATRGKSEEAQGKGRTERFRQAR